MNKHLQRTYIRAVETEVALMAAVKEDPTISEDGSYQDAVNGLDQACRALQKIMSSRTGNLTNEPKRELVDVTPDPAVLIAALAHVR